MYLPYRRPSNDYTIDRGRGGLRQYLERGIPFRNEEGGIQRHIKLSITEWVGGGGGGGPTPTSESHNRNARGGIRINRPWPGFHLRIWEIQLETVGAACLSIPFIGWAAITRPENRHFAQ